MPDDAPSAEVIPLPSRGWLQKCQQSRSGYRANFHNACIMLREAVEFRGRLAFDEFAIRTVIVAPLPWDEGEAPTDADPRHWTENDDNCAMGWAQAMDVQLDKATLQQAVETVAYEARFHPVRQYLAGLRWDGVERLSTFLSYHFGVELTPYTKAVARATMISAVARIQRPGCKADHMPILEGMQGILKSSGIRALVGADWYTDELADLGSKDAALQMRGKWIIELAELDQLSRADASRAKAWVSRQVDRFRPPFGRRLIEVPRECVFIGSINPSGSGYFKDETGNRRYWPVKCTAVDIAAIEADRDQLWAEALAAYKAGEQWWITDPEVAAAAREEQAERDEVDPWDETVHAYVASYLADDGFRTADILEKLGVKQADRNSGHARRIAKIMTRAGYCQLNSRGGMGGRRWVKRRDA